MTSCIGVLMLHITFSKYDCIIVHKAYYVFTCTCVSINSFHSHSHSHSHILKRSGPIMEPWGLLLKLASWWILHHRSVQTVRDSLDNFLIKVWLCLLFHNMKVFL